MRQNGKPPALRQALEPLDGLAPRDVRGCPGSQHVGQQIRDPAFAELPQLPSGGRIVSGNERIHRAQQMWQPLAGRELEQAVAQIARFVQAPLGQEEAEGVAQQVEILDLSILSHTTEEGGRTPVVA